MSKPTVKLIGENGNVYNLIGLTVKALKRAGLHKEANELQQRAFSGKYDYDGVLVLIMEYVEVE